MIFFCHLRAKLRTVYHLHTDVFAVLAFSLRGKMATCIKVESDREKQKLADSTVAKIFSDHGVNPIGTKGRVPPKFWAGDCLVAWFW